jgi:hypothetical protein
MLPLVGDGGPGVGSGGESWALERGSRRGVETGERAGQRAGTKRLDDSAAEWVERGEGGGSGRGVPRSAGMPWGLAPTGGNREGREASDGWAGTMQGGGAANRQVRLVSGTGERGVRSRRREWAGLRRKGDGPPVCTVRFCIYLN